MLNMCFILADVSFKDKFIDLMVFVNLDFKILNHGTRHLCYAITFYTRKHYKYITGNNVF